MEKGFLMSITLTESTEPLTKFLVVVLHPVLVIHNGMFLSAVRGRGYAGSPHDIKNVHFVKFTITSPFEMTPLLLTVPNG